MKKAFSSFVRLDNPPTGVKLFGAQPGSGRNKVSNDINMSLNFYYDFQSNFPLVSTSSYPTSTHDAGMTLKFTLTR